jgi:ribosome maturation factor RimP
LSERHDDDHVVTAPVAENIERLLEPSLTAMGYEIVRIVIMGKHKPTLQVMAERRDGQPMTVEDCADISRQVSAVLDVEDPIRSSYTLEVSSPGVDRPLTRPKDFQRFAGFEAKLETRQPIDGRRRFTGRLLGLDGEVVRLKDEAGEVALPYAQIQKARLVLTDELLKAAQAQSQH